MSLLATQTARDPALGLLSAYHPDVTLGSRRIVHALTLCSSNSRRTYKAERHRRAAGPHFSSEVLPGPRLRAVNPNFSVSADRGRRRCSRAFDRADTKSGGQWSARLLPAFRWVGRIGRLL